MGNAGRVAALLALDDLAAEALTPDGELLDGRGPERVASGHHHFLAFFLAAAGQLGDARRLPRAVDARDHHQGRPGEIVVQTLLRRGEKLPELFLDKRLNVAANLLVQERLPDPL